LTTAKKTLTGENILPSYLTPTHLCTEVESSEETEKQDLEINDTSRKRTSKKLKLFQLSTQRRSQIESGFFPSLLHSVQRFSISVSYEII